MKNDCHQSMFVISIHVTLRAKKNVVQERRHQVKQSFKKKLQMISNNEHMLYFFDI